MAQPKLLFAVACALLLGTAGVAQARVAFADNGLAPGGNNNTQTLNGATFDVNTIGTGSGSLGGPTPLVTTALPSNPFDGTMGLTLEPATNLAAGTTDFRFEWQWVAGTTLTNTGGLADLNLRIFLANVGTNITALNVTSVVFAFDAFNTDTATFSLGTPVDLLASIGTNGVAYLDLSGLTPTSTTGSPDLTFQTFRKTYIDIDIVASGITGGAGETTDQFSIDAIATTPEPGTWALFGLGLLGLGGIARRRKKRLAAKRA